MSEPRIKQLRRNSVDPPDSETHVPTQAISLAMRADWQRILRDSTSCGAVYLQLGDGVACTTNRVTMSRFCAWRHKLMPAMLKHAGMWYVSVVLETLPDPQAIAG